MTNSSNDDRKRPARSLLSMSQDEQRDKAQSLFDEARKSGYRHAPPAHSRAINPLLRALSEEEESRQREIPIDDWKSPVEAEPETEDVIRSDAAEDDFSLEEDFAAEPDDAYGEPYPDGAYDEPDPEEDFSAEPVLAGEELNPPDPRPDLSAAEPRSMEPDYEPEAWRPLFDPATVLAGVARSKSIIIAMTVAGAIGGAAFALSTPKEYASTAELLVDPRELKLLDRELTDSGLPYDATLAIVENQVRILTSRSVLARVVSELSLDRDPEFNGSLETGLGQHFSSLKSLVAPGESDTAAKLRDTLAIEHLSENLSVERGGKTFVISITMRTQNAEKSALIANKVIEVFLQAQGDFQSNTAARASNELTGRLEELRDGVELAERKVEAFKSENDLIDAQGRLITDDAIVRLNEQLSNAKAQTITLNARAESARNLDVGQVVSGSLPEQVGSGVLAELRGQYAALKQETTLLATKLGPRHPQLAAANAQLEGAREEIEAELGRIVASVQVDLKRAVQQEQELAAQLARMKTRQARVSEELVTLRELEREAAAQRAVYEAFLLRARETDEQKDINTANISVISEAIAPLQPSGVSRKFIAAAGAVLGFLSGIGIGILRGAADSFRYDRGGSTGQRPPGHGLTGRRPRDTHGMFRDEPTSEGAGGRPQDFAAGDMHPGTAHEFTTDPEASQPEWYETDPDGTQPETSEMNPAPQPAPMAPQSQDTAQPAPQSMPAQQGPVGQAVPQPAAAPAYVQPAASAWPQPAPQPVMHHPVAVQAYQAPPVQQPPANVYPYPAPHQYAAPQQPFHQPMPPQSVQHPMPPQPMHPMHAQAAAMPMYQPVPYPVPYPMPQDGYSGHPMYSGAAYHPRSSEPRMYGGDRYVRDSYYDEPSPVEEILDSLREFREAVRTFSDVRARRG